MIKLVSLLILIAFAIISCNSKKTSDYTVLYHYTFIQNSGSPEKLAGKVEKVTQKSYWAIPDGNTFIKGNPLTDKERDSLGWFPNSETTFDNSGDPVSCNWLYANNKSFRGYEMLKENNILTLAKLYYNDTLGKYEKIRHNADGDIIEQAIYSAGVDTLLYSVTYKYSMKRDTEIMQFYDYNGIPNSVISKRIALVDKDGKFLNFTLYKEDGTRVRGQEFKYNKKGDCIEMIYSGDTKENIYEHNYISQFEYDKKGNWIRNVVKNIDGSVCITERTYTYFE